MTLSHWQRAYPQPTSEPKTDVAIVGGGFAGLATAFWLTELRPSLKVTVLERTLCGSGASGKNAGFLTMGSASFYRSLMREWGKTRALSLQQFARESIDLVHQHILRACPKMTFERTTSQTLIRTDAQMKELGESFQPADFHFLWKTQGDLHSRLRKSFLGALENGPEFKVNPLELLQNLRTILEARSVTVIEHASTFDIFSDGVLTDTQAIRANQVVLALNGYFPEFHSAFKPLIVPRRAQMLAVELEDDFDCPGLYYDPPERVYWRKSEQNILVIGGKRLLDEAGETGDFEKVSPVIQRGLEAYLRDELGLGYKVRSRWSGIMGFTAHELPYIDRITAPVETFVIGGFSGHGMGLGFKSGKEMAEMVLGMKPQSFFSSFKKAELSLA